MPREITTQTQKVWLRADGIVQTANVVREEMTLAHAKENVAACAKVAGGLRRPIFVDTSVPAPLARDAQVYYTSAETARVATAVGILATNTLGRVVGNLFLAFARKELPVRLFETEKTAVQWLCGYLASSSPGSPHVDAP